MKIWLAKGTLLAAIALPALSGAAWAGGSDDFGCSNATLKGEYAFGVTAYTPPGLPDGPSSVGAGIKVFDGRGSLSATTEVTPYERVARPILRQKGKKSAPTWSIPTAPAAWRSI